MRQDRQQTKTPVTMRPFSPGRPHTMQPRRSGPYAIAADTSQPDLEAFYSVAWTIWLSKLTVVTIQSLTLR